MTSIGKFVVAGAAATQESTVALASINFDFSLVKMEAPLEYRGLGFALSSKRKRDAEEGPAHITARKLGALFADDLPHTPSLSRAYGLRVSEIAENPQFNPRGSYRDGPFVDNVGADGTSIWAAATSGRGALAVHLLACILARVWSSPEAISIWSEIITARKSLLQSRIQGQEFHLGTVTACQVDIERDKLAEWDASARSWLRTADSAMKFQQTQLMLIVDNIRLQTPSKATVYDEVMEVWTKAMVMADKVISGVAQRVQNADELLGLCAWHIYPDICAIGVKVTNIEQKDNLVKKGGLLTIGLLTAGEESSTGVSWSMPLAHLRFYGKPVVSSAAIGSATSRVPFHCAIDIIFGILTGEWQSATVDFTKVTKFLVEFGDFLHSSIKDIMNSLDDPIVTSSQHLSALHNDLRKYYSINENGNTAYWPDVFAFHARAYLRSSEDERQGIARYFALGRRRYGIALGKAHEHPSPHFGLSETGLYIKLTPPEERISKLREMANQFSSQGLLERAIIRLMHPQNSIGYQIIEFATLFPQTIEGVLQKTHRRWIVFPNMHDGVLHRDTFTGLFSEPQMNAIQRSLIIMRSYAEPCGFLHPSTFKVLGQVHDNFPSSFMWNDLPPPIEIPQLMDKMAWAEHILPANQRAQGWQMGQSKHVFEAQSFRYLYGDNSSAAVYHSLHGYQRSPFDFALPADFIIRALANGDLDPARFVTHFIPLSLTPLMSPDTSTYFRSLISFAHADEIYAGLPQAEIHLNIFTKTLCASNWAKTLLRGTDTRPSRTISLSCASFFDTGYLDLQVDDLEDVIAISSGNSIYACEFLFSDPSQRPPEHDLRHVIGNVGKPGLGLLLSPRDTVLREPDLDTLQLVNHMAFDGRFEDNFASTTLHLSLTGYEQRLNTSRYGCRDKEAFYLEAVVSAFDKGTWVADLDLLHFLRGRFLRIDDFCTHDPRAQEDSSIFHGLTSIDNWYEYLDRPPNDAIIRSSGNWMARLAFAAIRLADNEPLILGHDMILGHDSVCWACVMDTLRQGSASLEGRLILC